MKKKIMKISVLAAVLALTVSSAAFVSSAYATDTVTPSPTPIVSPPAPGTTDSGASDDSDAQAILSVQVDGTLPAQENDNEVDAINTEDAQEQASFDSDIQAAVQAGDSDAAAQLTAAAAIVTSVSVPEVQAMAADDTEAHNVIVGATK